MLPTAPPGSSWLAYFSLSHSSHPFGKVSFPALPDCYGFKDQGQLWPKAKEKRVFSLAGGKVAVKTKKKGSCAQQAYLWREHRTDLTSRVSKSVVDHPWRPAQGTVLQTTYRRSLWELFPKIKLWKVKYCKVSPCIKSILKGRGRSPGLVHAQ